MVDGDTDDPSIESRVNALIATARTAWFANLALVSYLGVAALGVSDFDFFALGRAMQLPLVDIQIPTQLFFIFAPILAAASYSYLHLYLIRLIDALADAPERLAGRRIGEVFSPWIVVDSLLRLRDKRRNERTVHNRPLDGALLFFNFFNLWLFGPLVICLLWWSSMIGRNPLHSSIAVLGVASSLLVGGSSAVNLYSKLVANNAARFRKGSNGFALVLATTIGALCIYLSVVRTQGSSTQLSEVDLSNASFVAGADEWVVHDIAEREFFEAWCRTEGNSECNSDAFSSEEFRSEWRNWREFQVNLAPSSSFGNAVLSNVNFDRAFLPGIDFAEFTLDYANFSAATIELADFTNASLRGARFFGAEAAFSDFSDADLSDARFRGASFRGASFARAKLQLVILDEADFRESSFSYAYISSNSVQHALNHVRRSLSPFSFSSSVPEILGAPIDISGATFSFTALRNIDLSNTTISDETDLSNVFFDGTVRLPDGIDAPRYSCHPASSDILDDEEFFGRWRGWIESNSRGAFTPSWVSIAPEGWADVNPIAPGVC